VGVTANDMGAFVQHSITDRALSTQLYIAVAALTTLCLAAVVTERRRAALELVRSRARIAAAGAEERRRLEHELHDSAQNRLVGLLIRLRLAQDQAEQVAPEVAGTLEDLLEDAERVGDELRRIAHGISPPLLGTRRGRRAANRVRAQRDRGAHRCPRHRAKHVGDRDRGVPVLS
jgi:signal transduction histidine kinase